MFVLEVIATSPEDCAAAERAGAGRIELCAALELGGLTPSAGLMAAARAATRLPIVAMVRPRAGGCCYSAGEFAAMRRDAAALIEAGADGLVFGLLRADGTLDRERCAALIALAAGRQAVFHRAFDLTPDPQAALEELIGLGVTRVLTSGGAASAPAGAEAIARLVRQSAGRIEVLPGGGVTPTNAAALLAATGCTQVHASCSGWAADPSAAGRGVRFGTQPAADETRVRVLDPALVRDMRRALAA